MTKGRLPAAPLSNRELFLATRMGILSRRVKLNEGKSWRDYDEEGVEWPERDLYPTEVRNRLHRLQNGVGVQGVKKFLDALKWEIAVDAPPMDEEHRLLAVEIVSKTLAGISEFDIERGLRFVRAENDCRDKSDAEIQKMLFLEQV